METLRNLPPNGEDASQIKTMEEHRQEFFTKYDDIRDKDLDKEWIDETGKSKISRVYPFLIKLGVLSTAHHLLEFQGKALQSGFNIVSQISTPCSDGDVYHQTLLVGDKTPQSVQTPTQGQSSLS